MIFFDQLTTVFKILIFAALFVLILGDHLNAQTQVGEDISGGFLFGDGVAISADGLRVAVGASGENGSRGQASVYEFASGSWSLLGQTINGIDRFDSLGEVMALSADGNTLVLGIPGSDSNGPNRGVVKVYRYDAVDWIQIGGDIVGSSDNDFFGSSVAISANGNTICVGAIQGPPEGTINVGYVKNYSFDGAAWQQIGQALNGESNFDRFGVSVDITDDGSTIIVGAFGDDTNGANSGHAKVYDLSGQTWIQRGSSINGDTSEDWFGISVTISADGNTVAVAAPFNDAGGSGAGQLKVLSWDSSSGWTLKGLPILGEAPGDWMGQSDNIDISADGNIVAIGSRLNGSSGHARLFIFENNQWSLYGNELTGDQAGGAFGEALRLSADGNRLIVGDYGGTPDRAQVFDFQSTLPVNLLSFTSRRSEKNVILKWITSTEINNKSFRIHRSANGNEWSLLGTLLSQPSSQSSQGNTRREYFITDSSPLQGANIYRLSQEDYDGTIQVLGIVQQYVHSVTADQNLLAYPNPTIDGSATIIFGEEIQTGEIVIFNLSGAIIYQQAINESPLLISNLPSGTHSINLYVEGQLLNSKILRSN